ncbi:uracil-DNA glycosylase family protein [Sandarakinorhabdus sp. AAP62]|uniref:uracil-DNA glycosylase family protein n=1 Tax=Sandarakinorhabdus sp. AAP62 TaxID=1248916 RepID=UPI0002FF27B6|nr:uracil-DNA glycosylase family protein [Sandarakinorhabdus sp. AAP62]
MTLPHTTAADPGAALAFLVSAGATEAMTEQPRRWLDAPPPRTEAAAPAMATPAPRATAPAAPAAEHPARACADIPALLALLGRFPDARTRPPLLFHGALEARVWVLIDRPDADPTHRDTIDRMLAAIDLDWNRAALVSRLPWPTPGDGEPTASSLARFTPVVERLAELAPPAHVLALGQAAAELAGSQARLGSSRGRWFDWRAAQLMPSIHPRAMGGNKELKRQAFEHLKLFRAAIA